MKKIVSLLLVLIMTFSLSACEIKLNQPNTSSSKEEISGEGEDNAAETPQTSEKTETSDVENNASSKEDESASNDSSEVGEPSKDTANSKTDESSEPGHTHFFAKATCTEPKECSCGATLGAALGHNWKSATCTAAKECTRCGDTNGSALGHSWIASTCTTAKECTRCGSINGSTLGHNWKSATCTTAMKCTRCGDTNGSALGHSWKDATCTSVTECTRCGYTNNSALGHSWKAATCTTAKKCTRCGSTSGSALGHRWNPATCTTPKFCDCGETQGDVLGHDYSSGKCKSCGVVDANYINGKSWNQVLTSMPKKLKGSKIVVYNWNPAAEYTGAPFVIEEFEKETGIKVEWMRVNYTEYVTKLAGLIASGLSPDVVRTRQPVPERLEQFQSLDIAKYDFTDAAWDKNLMKDYTVNGVTYATSLKNTNLGSVGMMFYNKALIKKYEMEDPYVLWKNGEWNTSKFIEMCIDFVKESGNKVGAAGMTYDKWSQMHGIAGNIAYENGKFVNKMGDANLLRITQEFADFYNTNKIFNQGQAEIFDIGGTLFYAGASVYARKKNSYFGTLKAQGDFYAVPMPAVSGQKTYYQSKDEYEAYAIARGAKNPQAVPYFLRYFLDGANYDLENFFCNKQNLEVYNWCMAQKNTIWSVGYYDPTENMYKTNGHQIKSHFNSIASLVQDEVNELNKKMNRIGY